LHLRGLFSTRAIFTKGTCRPYLLSWGNPLSLPPPRGRQRMLSVQPTSPHRETAASNGPPEDLTLKHRRSLQARSRSSKSQVAILEPRLVERLHAHRPRTASHPYQWYTPTPIATNDGEGANVNMEPTKVRHDNTAQDRSIFSTGNRPAAH
jgi:hypothetical protein